MDQQETNEQPLPKTKEELDELLQQQANKIHKIWKDSVTHYLNNPLAITLGYSEILSDSDLSPEQKGLAREILVGAKITSEIIIQMSQLQDIKTRSWGNNVGATLDIDNTAIEEKVRQELREEEEKRNHSG